MRKRRISAWAGLVCAGGLLLASQPASATPPNAATGSFDLPGIDTAGSDGFCPFAVTVSYINNEQITEQVLPDGTKIDTYRGTAFATITNDKTGKSVTYTISGPGTYTYPPDNSFMLDAAGPNLLWTTVADSYPGVPQLNFTRGHVKVEVNSTGLTTSFQLAGNSVDVCAALT
jgi:hypothetical protein